MQINYARRKIPDSQGNWVDPISARLSRMMLLADCEDYAAALPRFQREALGLIRADGILLLILPLFLWIIVQSVLPSLLSLAELREPWVMFLCYAGAQMVLALLLLGFFRDALTDAFGPEAAFALRKTTILEDLERKNLARQKG